METPVGRGGGCPGNAINARLNSQARRARRLAMTSGVDSAAVWSIRFVNRNRRVAIPAQYFRDRRGLRKTSSTIHGGICMHTIMRDLLLRLINCNRSWVVAEAYQKPFNCSHRGHAGASQQIPVDCTGTGASYKEQPSHCTFTRRRVANDVSASINSTRYLMIANCWQQPIAFGD